MKLKFNKINELYLMLSIFLIEFATYTKNIISITNYSQTIINIALVILFLFSILKLIVIKPNIKIWFTFLILIILAFFSYIVTKESLILQLCFLLIAAYNIEFKKIIKYDLVFRIILLLFILFNYKFSNVGTLIFTRSGEIRYAYGFNQPNVFSIYIIAMFFEYMYLHYNSENLMKKTLLFLVSLYFVNKAKSRSSEIILIIFFSLYLYTSFRKKNKANKIKKTNCKKTFITYFLLFLILTIITYITTNDFLNKKSYAILLDNFLSGRLLLQSIFNNMYQISLFGNEIDYFNTLDNAYMRILLNYGVIAWIVYGFIYSYILMKADKNEDKIITFIFRVFFIYGLMEWYILRPALNVFLLYFSANNSINQKEGDNNEKK